MLGDNTNVKLNISGDTLTAHISGEIDHHSAKGIRETVDSALVSYSPDELIMDLSGVSFMDSSGLGLILGRKRKTDEMGIGLVLINPTDGCKKILRLAGMEHQIEMKNM